MTISNKKKGYIVVTAHYIDSSWTLKSQILRYVKIIELLIYYLHFLHGIVEQVCYLAMWIL